MKLLTLMLCFLVCTLPALSQAPHLSFGAVGGVRLSGGAPAGYHDESPRYTLGPTFEVSFGEHLAVESSALYKRFGSSTLFALSPQSERPPLSYLSIRHRTDSWEFPILGKYYFGRRNQRDRFFVATGYSFQRSWATSSYNVITPNPSAGGSVGVGIPIGPRPPVVVGAAFGAGLARKAGPLTVTPAFRYTRWGYRTDGTSRNQAEILLTLSF